MSPRHSSPAALPCDASRMREAIALARRGEGTVEPNPMVGCVIYRDDQCVGRGWHRQYGHAHAEVDALNDAGENAFGATAYVTLEPCCHHGKTPPCADALIAAGVRRVVVGCEDPNPQVAGKGLARLAAHGIELLVGVELESAAELIAPFAKLMRKGMPWVIAKWGMTLDGKIAASDGSSQWITNSLARQRVHALRRRVDAVMVGSRTALADNPQLIARPPGPRVTQRVIFDSMARLPVTSQLAQTAGKHPTLLAVSANANPTHLHALRELGVETLVLDEAAPEDRMLSLLAELGRRRVTNLLVEGGGTLLGALFDLQQIDEVYAFVAPRLLGGDCATTPIAGQGAPSIAQMLALKSPQLEIVGDNLAVSGRIRR